MRSFLLVPVLVAALLSVPAPAPVAASVATDDQSRHCARMGRIDVPKAPMQKVACLDDLTTASTSATGHTDPSDWASLHAPGTENPSGVPGIQVDGYFPDTSTSNAHNGWNHDSQFVIRLPDDWNGGVVVSGAPGTRTQYAGDSLFSDWVLARGYAYASTDKGNNGSSFYADGQEPGDAIAEWNHRVTQLTRATKEVLTQRYGREPRRTYAVGISNGGYLVRWQLENRPGLYDGGIDWEGTLYQADRPNLLTYLPVALRHYPAYAATGDAAAHEAMIKAGFQRGVGVHLGLPLRRLLGPHPAALPRGARSVVRRRHPGRDTLLPERHPELRRGLQVRRPAGRAEGTREGRTDRRREAADAHPARHPRRAAPDPDGLRRLPADDQEAGQRESPPLLPGPARNPRRRPLQRVRRPGPPDPAVRGPRSCAWCSGSRTTGVHPPVRPSPSRGTGPTRSTTAVWADGIVSREDAGARAPT